MDLIVSVSKFPYLLYHSANYIFISFGIIWSIMVSLRVEVLLMFTLECVSSVANSITAQ